MTATEVELKKLNRHEAELVEQIWNELARIHGWKPVKDSASEEEKSKHGAAQAKILKRHINRPDGTLKNVPHLIDERNELRSMDSTQADDRD